MNIVADLLGELGEQHWMDQAACRPGASPVSPNAFFDAKGNATTAARTKACRRCPVAGECLAYSLDMGIQQGTWGGVGQNVRRQMIAARNRAAQAQVNDVPIAQNKERRVA